MGKQRKNTEEDDNVKIYLPFEDSENEQDSDILETGSEKDEESKELSMETSASFTKIQQKTLQELKKVVKSSKQLKSQETGVVYLARIPHGFYEEEMNSYFSQFGTVVRLRLSRNKKTGKSKHYAFIEFESKQVAEIVADTMDNYLLSNHVLVCKVVPKEKIHANMFVGSDSKYKALPWNKMQRQKHNRTRTVQEHELHVTGLLEKHEKKQEKLKELGMDYEIPRFRKRSAIVEEQNMKKVKVELETQKQENDKVKEKKSKEKKSVKAQEIESNDSNTVTDPPRSIQDIKDSDTVNSTAKSNVVKAKGKEPKVTRAAQKVTEKVSKAVKESNVSKPVEPVTEAKTKKSVKEAKALAVKEKVSKSVEPVTEAKTVKSVKEPVKQFKSTKKSEKITETKVAKPVKEKAAKDSKPIKEEIKAVKPAKAMKTESKETKTKRSQRVGKK